MLSQYAKYRWIKGGYLACCRVEVGERKAPCLIRVRVAKHVDNPSFLPENTESHRVIFQRLFALQHRTRTTCWLKIRKLLLTLQAINAKVDRQYASAQVCRACGWIFQKLYDEIIFIARLAVNGYIPYTVIANYTED